MTDGKAGDSFGSFEGLVENALAECDTSAEIEYVANSMRQFVADKNPQRLRVVEESVRRHTELREKKSEVENH